MSFVNRVMLVLALIGGVAVAAAAQPQPTTGNEGDLAWWGAGFWILFTAVVLIGAILFVVKGLKEPNRR